MEAPVELDPPGLFGSDARCVKTMIGDSCQNHLADPKLYGLLEKIDADLVAQACAGDCRFCLVGKLHRADYCRKPRGLKCWPKDPKATKRFSLCCDREGCRRRHTPPSVRFLGRRVYGGVAAVLLPAMVHGLQPGRIAQIRQALGLKIDRRTLERWRQWWLGSFVQGTFWKAARARFMPPLDQPSLPWSLCLQFKAGAHRGLLDLLRFLAPITTPQAWQELVM
jgi:hypothetical protein